MQSASSSNVINQHFSQLGVPFVRDRTVSVLQACGVAVSQPMTPRKRRARVESPSAAECAVCQDGAAGFEYGAAACDSCQNFFERTVRLRLIHDCHFRRGCDLRLNRRNHCLGCRWDRCLEVGMSPSAVKKRRNVNLETEAWDSGHKSHQLSWSPQAATPQPSLPSLTDTEDSNQDSYCGGGGGDSTDSERAGGHLLGVSPPDLPISPGLIRATLTPSGSPDSASDAEGLRACLASLERSCLVELFRWNKRRLVGYSERGFGAAAANWMPILVASAVRHYLERLPAAVSDAQDVAENLKGRLAQRIRGFDAEANDQLDSLTAGVGDLCGRLLDGVGCGGARCQKSDRLAEIILMMGDLGEDELIKSLQSTVSSSSTSSSSSALPDVIQSLLAVTELIKSARPELRALLITALTADKAEASSVAIDYVSQQSDPDTSGSLSTGKKDAIRMPGLIGL